MIDLHCHLLDETDCGPQSFAESLALCRRMVADGVRTIVATPRWDSQKDAPPISFADGERKLERLRGEMNDAVTLKLGFMMRMRPNLAQLLERYGSPLALGGGRYVLVSLPSLHTPDETEEVWDAVRQQGFAPLVARPECSPALRRSPERLQRWVAGGVKLQLDAASLTGAHGREVQGFAMEWAHQYQGRVVVASNGSGGRMNQATLLGAREVLLKKHGVRCARLLTRETPAAIINSARHEPHSDQADAKPANLFSRLRSVRQQKTLLNES
jgi:protein-tyrosine phosphatase